MKSKGLGSYFSIFNLYVYKKNTMTKTKILLFLLWVPLWIQAQIITTNPTFLTDDVAAEVIFDASSTALNNYAGDVYAHTGVITDKSTSSSDWKYAPNWLDNSAKYKLTSIGNNKWKLTMPSGVRVYYGVPAGEKILKLAFVFRSADGSKEGKDNGKDILVDVHEKGLLVTFETPQTEQLLDKNTSLAIKAKSSQITTLKLYLNDTQLTKVDNSTTLSYIYKFSAEGSFWLIAEAGLSPSLVRDSIYVNVKKDQVSLPLPSNVRAGVNYINDNTATVVLYAPKKTNVYLLGDFNNWKINNAYMFNKAGDFWWLTISNLEKGKEYGFQYLIDGTLKVADPYTDKVLDPWNDSYIPSTVYPNLKPYPTGKTEGIVSVLQTGQTPYSWKTKNFTPAEKDKLVIYELLIRDFTTEHSFESTMKKLDYLQSLGINAIELLPINEFEGNNSWGYNPSFYFAVDKYYGTKDAFKAFVDECHNRGIAVIIDMVLNHSYGQSPFVKMYWDNANNRPSADNPWYNTQSPNSAYSWGYDFNHESDQTKALVDSINSYWMKEYQVDGFRFDFTKGFTNKAGDGWAYDQSRIDILKRMSSEIYKRNPKAIVIMEHLADNSEEKVLSDADIMLWGNINNNYCEAVMGYTENNKSDLSWAIYSKRGWTKPNLVAYMESHDEERTMFKAKAYGNASGAYNIKNEATALKRAELAAAFYLTLPGPKMIWQFGELGYDYSINTCSDGTTISNDCRVAEKPIRWDYYENKERKDLYSVYSKLINLKTENKVFESTDINYSLEGKQKYVVWKGTNVNAFVVGNFDVVSATAAVTLPRSGEWYDALTGAAVTIPSTSYSVTLAPGEYKFYIDKGSVASIEDMYADNESLTILDDRIEYTNGVAKSITLYDLSGVALLKRSNTQSIETTSLSKGIYIVKLKLDGKDISQKFIKK